MRYYLEEIARRDAEIERFKTELSEQVATLAQRDAALAARDVLLEKKERALTELDALLAEKDAVIRELRGAYQDLGQQMEALQRSLGYRLLEGYRRGIRRLFPPGSLRGRTYRRFVQGLEAIVHRFAYLPRRRRPQR